jgi:hypothetical protein
MRLSASPELERGVSLSDAIRHCAPHPGYRPIVCADLNTGRPARANAVCRRISTNMHRVDIADAD